MSESHATKQMRAAINRVEKAVSAAQQVANRIESGSDADDVPDLRGMAVSISNLLTVTETAMDRCNAEVTYAEG